MLPRNSSRKPSSPSVPKAIRFVVRIIFISAPFHIRKKLIHTGQNTRGRSCRVHLPATDFTRTKTLPILLARGRKVIYRRTRMRTGRRARRPLRRTVPYSRLTGYLVHTCTTHTHICIYVYVYNIVMCTTCARTVAEGVPLGNVINVIHTERPCVK